MPAAELERAYEAVRARATGAAPAETPRGLGVLMARGLTAWMTSLAPVTRAATTTSLPPTSAPAPTSELASLLAEMALSHHRRCAA